MERIGHGNLSAGAQTSGGHEAQAARLRAPHAAQRSSCQPLASAVPLQALPVAASPAHPGPPAGPPKPLAPAEPRRRGGGGDVVWSQVGAPQPLPLRLGPRNHLLIRNISFLILVCCCCYCPLLRPTRWRRAACRQWRRRLRRRRQRRVAAAGPCQRLLWWRRAHHASCVHVVLEAVVLGRGRRLEAARQLEAAERAAAAARWLGAGQAAGVGCQLAQPISRVLACGNGGANALITAC